MEYEASPSGAEIAQNCDGTAVLFPSDASAATLLHIVQTDSGFLPSYY
jgi:hypothetical protein